MARFFIDRPIFAWVISIIIMLGGLGAILGLSIEQYPDIAPNTVNVTATYRGASAKTVEETVTQVIEQKMRGLDGFLYLSSQSSSTGSVSVTLTFDATVNPDIAQVQVQNKLQLAIPLLPEEVQRQGISVNKSEPGFLMIVAFVSEDGRLTDTDLSDFVTSRFLDVLRRVRGVGTTRQFGTAYAMRIWMDPDKLEAFQLTSNQIAQAIRDQNAQVSAGQLGGVPAVPGQEINATITAQTRLTTAEEFRNIIVKSGRDGSIVRLGDVARVELGADDYNSVSRFNGMPATGVAISMASGANAIETAREVKKRMEEFKPYLPDGVKVLVAQDITPFIEVSIDGVVETLFEAILLVFLVMFLFLQNIRATLIPTLAVPVVLLGTFGVLMAFGYTINTLTMFAMVLAIGLLVDDAIVVVENVERIMEEEGLSPKEATRKSMDQITSALIGITLVLSAVFVPMAFFGGSVGIIYRQFSVTIVSAMVLSVLTALIFTPALCATFLKHKDPNKENKGWAAWFNRQVNKITEKVTHSVAFGSKRLMLFMLLFLGISGATAYYYDELPTSFLPDEDQGSMNAIIQLPVGATVERTKKVVEKVEKFFMEDEKDALGSLFTSIGFSFAGSGQNMAMAFVKLKGWDERPDEKDSAFNVVKRASKAFSEIDEAMVFAFLPTPIRGLGDSSGWTVELQDRAGLGEEAMKEIRMEFLRMAAVAGEDGKPVKDGETPVLMGVRPNGLEDTPQLQLDIDQEKAAAFGVSIGDINSTLQAAWGSAYINDFIHRGRVKKVYLQADAPFRMVPEDINRWYVRNNKGEMVSFASFSKSYWIYGSPRLERFNGLPSYQMTGQAAPGVSSGTAMKAVENIIAQLPVGVGYEWSGLSYQEKQTGDQAMLLYLLSILIVFLSLAALYESWSVPFAVMLVVPLGIIGAVLATKLRGLSNDVYFQVGLLTTVGLSAKNAILIVEFAKEQVDRGVGLVEATLQATRLRFRPIVMTSLAFGLGVFPLAISQGAGSASQHAVGTSVLGGMISATVLGVFFVPLFFLAVRRVFSKSAPVEGTEGKPIPLSTLS